MRRIIYDFSNSGSGVNFNTIWFRSRYDRSCHYCDSNYEIRSAYTLNKVINKYLDQNLHKNEVMQQWQARWQATLKIVSCIQIMFQFTKLSVKYTQPFKQVWHTSTM